MSMSKDLDDLIDICSPENDILKIRKCMKNVYYLSSLNKLKNVEEIFPHVVKHLANSDLVIKKLASWFIIQHSYKEDLILLAINTLLKDISCANPVIRGMSLKTLCSLKHVSLLEYSIKPNLACLHDTNAYVRRIAVLCCLKISETNENFVVDHGVIDILYFMIRDTDTIVVINCLHCLDILLKHEGGIIINRNIAHYLLNKLGNFSEIHITYILRILKKYSPITEGEVFNIMNILDKYLKHTNIAITLECLALFINLIQNCIHLHQEVVERTHPQILHCICTGSSETIHLVLNQINSNFLDYKAIFLKNVSVLFRKRYDPFYLIQKKFEMLPLCSTNENVQCITDELIVALKSKSYDIRSAAAETLGVIGNLHSDFTSIFVNGIDLLFKNNSYISSLFKLCNSLKYLTVEDAKVIMKNIKSSIKYIEDEEGLSAIFSLIGKFGEHHYSSSYLISYFIKDSEIKKLNHECISNLLRAVVMMFIKQQPECQNLLGLMFEYCMNSNDYEINESAALYYHLLKTDCVNGFSNISKILADID